MVTIAPVPPGALAKFDPLIDFPTVASAGWRGDDLVALGGLSWHSGRCWLWYRVVDRDEHEGDRKHPHLIVREALRMLKKAKQLGEQQVFAWRDDGEPSSERLLKVVGFEIMGVEAVLTTDGMFERKEVWTKWLTRSL